MKPPPDPYSDDPLSWAFAIFRPISDLPGYGVDADGNAWSCRLAAPPFGLDDHWHLLRPGTVGPYRYRTIHPFRDGKKLHRYIHRLVLETFVGRCPPGMECLHRDGDTGNNALANLRWGTSAENSQDTIRLGNQCRGETIPFASLKDVDIPIIFAMRAAGLQMKEIAARFGVTPSNISYILRRKTWKHVSIPAPLI